MNSSNEIWADLGSTFIGRIKCARDRSQVQIIVIEYLTETKFLTNGKLKVRKFIKKICRGRSLRGFTTVVPRTGSNYKMVMARREWELGVRSLAIKKRLTLLKVSSKFCEDQSWRYFVNNRTETSHQWFGEVRRSRIASRKRMDYWSVCIMNFSNT